MEVLSIVKQIDIGLGRYILTSGLYKGIPTILVKDDETGFLFAFQVHNLSGIDAIERMCKSIREIYKEEQLKESGQMDLFNIKTGEANGN